MDFNDMIKRVVKRAALVGVGVCVAAMGACAPAHANEGTPGGLVQGWVTVNTGAPVDVSGTPACEDEGQEYGPCLWDATVSGNGSGDSFIVEEDGSVTYIRKQDGTAIGQDVKKKKSKKKDAEEASPAPEPTDPPEARRFPGWEWTGKTDPISAAGLPHCVDVRGQETCMRDGYVIVVDQDACTQTIVTDAGDQYVPGPAVAEALSDSCKARKDDSEEKDHENSAGISGTRSGGDVHSASPSAAVDRRVEKSASPSATATVGSVDSPRDVVAAPAPVKDNYDHEILGGVVALGLLGFAGAGLVSVVDRVRGWRRGRGLAGGPRRPPGAPGGLGGGGHFLCLRGGVVGGLTALRARLGCFQGWGGPHVGGVAKGAQIGLHGLSCVRACARECVGGAGGWGVRSGRMFVQ